MKKTFTVLILLVFTFSLSAQEQKFKALFMFNFAKQIEWTGQEEKNEFIIGVCGDNPIIEELNKLAASRKINNKTIVVKKVTTASEVPEANIFFLPSGSSGRIDRLTAFYKEKPTLIITEKDGSCLKGAGINYVMQDNKLKFEINRANIISHGLNVSSQLISLGIEIN